MSNDDGMRVWLDGKLLLDDWRDDAERTSSKEVSLQAGRAYDLKVEYYDNKIYAVAKLLWAEPNQSPYGDAIAAAKQADAVVMVLGISGAIENESHDRTEIDLPKVQRDLVSAVRAATKKPVILVLINGGPISLGAEELKSNGILEAWYPGQEGGYAVADVLFGKVSPAGRLPVTIVKSLADLPPLDDYRMKSRTYRYPGPKPLFPFGFGLSYTTFAYSDLIMPATLRMGLPLEIHATVENTGKVESDEVVQVYRHFLSPSKPMPERQLVGFKRIHLKPGERVPVLFLIPVEQLSVLGDDTMLRQEPGKIELSIGGGQPGFVSTLSRVVELK
jgi:beta-glucosidase